MDRVRLLSNHPDGAERLTSVSVQLRSIQHLAVVKRHCTDIVGLLADFVERHLPPEIHAELERHLAACPSCIAQVRTYESTVSLLRSIREEDLPAELRCTLKAFVDRNCGN